jgi:hypothetical protein
MPSPGPRNDAATVAGYREGYALFARVEIAAKKPRFPEYASPSGPTTHPSTDVLACRPASDGVNL